jgi:energy-coupling factor transporter ATP-binding protein EcfA2
MTANTTPGAKWWSVDFHAHSPSSFDFGASEGQKATTTTSVRDWLLAYMNAQVDVVVISDHNTHEGIDIARTALDQLRRECAEGFRELVVFPAVELTTDGNFHLLAIFDVDTASDQISGLLHRVQYQGDRGDSNGTTAKSFQEAVDEIGLMGGLAIPAHADGPRGLFAHHPLNIDTIVKTERIVAAEVVTEQGATRAQKYGWVPLLGSDAHHLDGSGCPEGETPKFPGSHYTWVKMSTPDLAGLRVAISDGSSSLIRSIATSENPNDVNHAVIHRLVIRLDGQESEHEFSPWMNAIIGGRGVGKSTLVELIRLALGRYDDLPPSLAPDLKWFSPNERDESSRFWRETTELELHYTRASIQYKVLWKGTAPSSPTIEAMTETGWEPQGGEARERFPVLLNSQKQIYETAKDPQSLLRVIDSQPSIDLPGWTEEFRRLCSQFRTKSAEIAELKVQISTKSRVKGELSDIGAELARRSQLQDSPEAKELELLNSSEQASIVREESAAELETSIAAAIAAFETSTKELSTVHAWTPEAERQSALEDAVETLTSTGAKLQESRERWTAALTSAPRLARIAELAALLEEQSPGVDSGESFVDLVAKKNALQRQLDDIDSAVIVLSVSEQAAKELLHDVTTHRRVLTERRKLFLSDLGDENLKVNLFEQASDSDLEVQLRLLTHKQSAFDSIYDEQGLRSVLPHRRSPDYVSGLGVLKELLKQLRRDGRSSTLLDEHPAIAIHHRYLEHLASIDGEQFAADVDLWFPEDYLNIKYRPNGTGNFFDLTHGSPGQKTAALLTLLLQIGREPLVLDQPEDDLDNRLIYDLVVAQLKAIKRTRQVIVVTHNANIVVNADAELVIVMEHGVPLPEGRPGSIQDKPTRDDICQIMEGGELAFKTRYDKLHLN